MFEEEFMSHTSQKYFTRGGQVTFHNLRMFVQIFKTISKVLLLVFFAVIIGYLYFFADHPHLLEGLYYFVGRLLRFFPDKFVIHIPFFYHGQWIKETQFSLTQLPFFYLAANYFLEKLFYAILMAFSVVTALFFVAVRWFTLKGKKQNSLKFIRGSRLVTPKELKKQIIKQKMASDLTIDGIPLIKRSEVQHTLIHGTTGAGKTQLVRKRLRQIRARGERVIVYDKGCTLTSGFFQEGDIILNPFDLRCASWDLWEEAPTAAHLENMAESLIPLHGQVDPFWVDAARTIFSSTAHRMRNDPDRSIEKLVQLLLTMELKDLEKYVKGTESATLTSDKIEKTAISIRSILTTYLKSMRFLFGLNTKDSIAFSMRNWILDESQTGWIFISSNGENHKALRPLISMWIAMGSLTILSLPINENRRIHVDCDELPSLHKLPLLPEILAEARKFGGCFSLGMQSFALAKAVYGYDAAAGILDLLNTRFFFRNPSNIMAKFVSDELSDMEVDDPQENYSYGANSIRDGISMSHQRVTRPIVMASEIKQLADLECYVQLPGQYPVSKLTLRYQNDPVITDEFIPRVIPEMGIVEEAIIHAPKIPELKEKSEEEIEKEAEQSIAIEQADMALKSMQRKETKITELDV